MSTEHDPLRRALHEQAETLHDAPVTLDDVKARAGGIRRRRRLTAGVGALAALAVLAPVGLVTLGGDDGQGTPVASDGAAAPPPEPVGVVDFTGRGLSGGAAPAVPYVVSNRVVIGDGRVAARGVARPLDAAETSGGLVVAGFAPGGGSTVAVVSPDGATRDVRPAPVPDAIASGEGGQVVWVQGTGDAQELAIADAGTPDLTTAPRVALPAGDGDAVGWRPVGIGPDGVVLEDGEGATGSVVLADARGGARPVPGLLRASGVDEGSGRIAGMVSSTDQGSCSAVVGVDGSKAWETCDYTLLDFSPDGQWVLATTAYRSGFGDSTTAVLDAETGELQVEWRSEDIYSSPTWISRRWENDRSFVAVLVAGNDVSLVRFGVDGSTEYAAGPVTVDDPVVDMPFTLPTD